MNRRALLFALAICGLLVLAGIWQLSAPPSRGKVFKPKDIEARLDEDTDAAQPLEADLTGSPLDTPVPQPKKLAPPPPPPPVENDPAKGRVWLRLLDSRNNRPVTDTTCKLIKCVQTTWSVRIESIPGQKATDRDGLVSLSAEVIDDIEGEEELSCEVVYDLNAVKRFLIALPTGWQPTVSYYQVRDQFSKLLGASSDKPIDIPVAPEATLRIVARDQWGQPLPNAEIEHYYVSAGLPAEDWIDFSEFQLPRLMADGWADFVDHRSSEFRRKAATAIFDGKQAAGGYTADVIGLDPTDVEVGKGNVMIRGLPCVRFGAIAYLSGIGFGGGAIDLQPGANELNVYLRAAPTCTLNVRIEWHGEQLDPADVPRLCLSSAGLFGESNALNDASNSSFRWYPNAPGGSVWQAQVTNLPPGCWQAQAEFWAGGEGHARVCLQAGEAAAITLYCGDGALAYWTPIIRLGGKQLEESSIRILGGDEYAEPTAETISCDSGTGETTEFELRAGTYTVWIPTLQPVQVTLLPGEKRSDLFELLCATVRFSIDAPLAELLSFEGADVQLNLYPTDDWDSGDEHLGSIDGDLRANDEAYDQLNPSVVRVWTVPLGSYRWHLIGTDQEMQGLIELMTPGSSSVHFGLRNLPGYELCEIEFAGFNAGEEPSLEFRDDGTASLAINAFGGSLESGLELTRNIWPEVTGDIHTVRSRDGTIIYAFGPAGAAQAGVYSEDRSKGIRASFPGRHVITPGQMESATVGRLLLQAPADSGRWHVAVFHENGESNEYFVNDEIEMAVGWITLVVTHEIPQETGVGYETARIQIKLTTGTQTLELNSLSYEPFAEVTLIFKGRGSPDRPFDAWWYGDAQPAPVLLALDQSFGGAPRYVGLGTPDRVMPDGRLEFCYDHRMLPPGRYKVIPWAGAAEKYCKTFTLAPGETSSVMIQGGS